MSQNSQKALNPMSNTDSGILDIDNIFLIGDLNFTTSPAEICGKKDKSDLLANFFINLMGIFNLIYIAPQVLEPNWINNRCGLECILKILDKFVVKAN